MGIDKNFPLGRRLSIVAGVLGLLLVGGFGFLAFDQSSASASFNGLPTETPRRDLPIALDRTTTPDDEQGLTVLDQTQVGDYIVVVGDFTEVMTRDGRILPTSGVYAYHIDTGELVESFLPELTRSNGRTAVVNAVSHAGGDSVVIGGQFNRAEDVFHNRLAKYNIITGQIDHSFAPDANASVTQLAYDGGRLFVGGDFTSISGVTRQRLAQINPNSGAVVNSFRFDITQSSRFNPTFTYGPRFIGVTRDDVLVVVHRGERVGGQLRPGITLIDLNSNSVLGYSTNYWGDGEIFAFDAALSPDGSYVVVVSNGGDFPLEGKDVGVRFDISNRNAPNQSERWVARNFDSTYSVAISNDAVFMGGHFCNVEGPGAQNPFPGIGEYTNDNSCFGLTPASRFPGTVNRDQLAAFDPATGHALDWDPGSSSLRGVQSLEVIDRGLLIGHDGRFIGRDGNDRRAWNVGLHGFLDIENPDGRPAPATVHLCEGVPATIVGTPGDDVLTGTAGRDVIVGLEGRDRIFGLGGNDIICGGPQNDYIDGGAGHDAIYGNEAADTLYGRAGNDLIVGGLWTDTIYGGTGDDVLRGSAGSDTIFGGAGSDELYGWTGIDKLDGGFGNDELYGQVGRDQLQGNAGSDLVHGGIGRDLCVGAVFGNPDSPGDVRQGCER